jgi:2-oxo-4-hydroxy-4-carboxy--5-ureidoimidazoline (OHCU) decarboxylase
MRCQPRALSSFWAASSSMRRNSKESALAAFRTRLDADGEAEEATALEEIRAITRFRLDALIQP